MRTDEIRREIATKQQEIIQLKQRLEKETRNLTELTRDRAAKQRVVTKAENRGIDVTNDQFMEDKTALYTLTSLERTASSNETDLIYKIGQLKEEVRRLEINLSEAEREESTQPRPSRSNTF